MSAEICIVVCDDCPPGSIYVASDGRVTCHPGDIGKAARVGLEHLRTFREIAGLD